jgi:hypothetical protein
MAAATTKVNYSSASSVSSEKKRGLGAPFRVFKRRASANHVSRVALPWTSACLERRRSHSYASTTVMDSTECFRPISQATPTLPVQSSGCMLLRTQEESLNHTNLESKKTAETKKGVRFSEVEVQSYGIMLGDNPAVSSGPPITIEWKPFDCCVLSVEDFECNKPVQARRGPDMLVPRYLREEWIRNSGFARSEMVKTQKQIRSIQRSRQAAIAQSARLQ